VTTTKPRKQRKKLYEAPKHLRHKQFSALLSSDLKNSYKTHSVPVRKGDSVRVIRGEYRGFEGKVTELNLKKYRILVGGITREKTDGTEIPVQFHPSKVMITKLKLDDKWRKKSFERKGALEKPKERNQMDPKPKESKLSKSDKKTGGK
jgi:large subunit ribosomal protein L24